MNSLEFIEKEIDVTKKQLAKYPLSKEQSDPNYKHKEADIQYIHNKYYTEQLQTLNQIKSELEEYQKLKEKEKTKKVIRYSGMSYDYNEIDFFTCPNCRNLYKGQKYCDECGQALSPEIYNGEIDEDRGDE